MYTAIFLLALTILAISSRARMGNLIAINQVVVRLRQAIARGDTTYHCSMPKVLAQPTSMAAISISDEVQIYKVMFHQLENTENYPSVRPLGRELLTSWISECLSEAKRATSPTILSIEVVDPEAIRNFIKAKEQLTTSQWEAYLSRRKAGAPRELFANRSSAETWLKRKAPLRYVDGAWLGHIHKVHTPCHLRAITRSAWQILAEELGDGDLAKSHVNVYRALLKQVGVELPDSHDIGSIHPRHGLDDRDVWRAAVIQLLISLYPQEFLPELLGFNLHFELLTFETLKAVKESKELAIDATYFLLHVCIDNGDSGHTAMATKIVLDYVQLVMERDGPQAALKAWQRIQLGFLLSESLDHSASSLNYATRTYQSSAAALETDVVRIFKAKASVAQKLHSACPMKLSGRTIAEWLDPQALESKEWQQRRQTYEITCLGGSMFGSFTQTEVKTIARWIDALDCSATSKCPDRIGLDQVLSALVVVQREGPSADWMECPEYTVIDDQVEAFEPPETDDTALGSDLSRPVILEKFLPLWFVQSCLLESFICVPSTTCSTVVAAAIQVLRAQHGFSADREGVAGMDEVHRSNVLDLITIGQDMMSRAGLASADLLTEVLQQGDCGDALTMLNLSSKPMANQKLLIGICSAFADLHTAMVSAKTFHILGAEMAEHLTEIASRERLSLDVCRREFDNDKAKRRNFHRGFQIGKLAFERCF